ncbi:helix-turn-helix transcriptional regulator [Kitasatospora sp. SUK 42]|uniref:helix-turn-helix transcriptional regulator n=1 Tax=Kitasatospora sp. SUK 42 TaxID=1588882 RepID=UPI0018C9A98C|nr:helix-turn-helix transcriptional regulator [Kitasatospora sp. SUK 42]MBV2155586.1 helix-turn-helix transcriptional regulator [Kitasatospora sp. SUK 42]
MDTKIAIRDFLVSRRTRLRPQDVGMPALAGQRRVEGLRREEIAALAHVSVDQYVRLERGQASRVSDTVIDAVATALRLTPAEHRYLHGLARPAPPPRTAVRRGPVRPSVQCFLDSLRAAPAYLVGHGGAILAWNRLATRVFVDFAEVPEDRRTLGWVIFTNPRAREAYVDWPLKAHEAAAYLRNELGRHPHCPELTRQIEQLCCYSQEFDTLWRRHGVVELSHGVTRARTRFGVVELCREILRLAGEPGEFVILHTPATPDAAAALASLEAPGTD